MTVFIIFPHQLFEDIKPLLKVDRIYLIEEALFFKQYTFHKQKLLLHRASMQFYREFLINNQLDVNYVAANDVNSTISDLIKDLHTKGVQKIICYNVVDDWLGRRLRKAVATCNIDLEIVESPLFLNSHKHIVDYFATPKKYLHNDFYILQRKRFDVLVTKDGKPIGDKWSFDSENRLKYPKGKIAPYIERVKPNKYYIEAKEYVTKYFSNNLGYTATELIFPTTFEEAKDWLQDFLKNRFNEFGPYEDAIVDKELILNHSVLTPILNIGLLTPLQIVNAVLKYATKNNIALQNTEGFIRQIIGWREFIRGVYVQRGRQQRISNYWNFTKKIPKAFYTGTTGILPIDDVIKKVLTSGYCHHIERLMVLGNFMLLCELDPNEVYRWFMELFIDAYDWVMVPNVYGMSQFADGGIMATKPYISGSNYIIKMSNYKKGNDSKGWEVIWDALFWRFMHKQRNFFLSNPRLGMLVHTFDKMSEEKRNAHLQVAEKFLLALK